MNRKLKLGVMAVTAIAAAAIAAVAASSPSGPTDFTNVTSPQPRTVGISSPNVLSPELTETIVAQGSMPLDGGTPANPYYGYNGNGPMVPAVNSNVEATKTEPDKNTRSDDSGDHDD